MTDAVHVDRSPSGAQPARPPLPATLQPWARWLDWLAPDQQQAVGDLRITSYNVCYTKLLRVAFASSAATHGATASSAPHSANARNDARSIMDAIETPPSRERTG